MICDKVFPWQEDKWRAITSAELTLAPALLFHGPAGIGKLAFAQRFAQSLLCDDRSSDRVRPCGECDSCALFGSSTHPDYLLVEPEAEAPEEGEQTSPSAKTRAPTHISIAAARAIVDFNQLSSSRGQGKVTLLHPAEAMNHNASNALLKTLEESAPGSRFILVSHRPGKLAATIISRCSKVAFNRPDREVALRWLNSQKVPHASVALSEAAGAPVLAHAQQNDAAHMKAVRIVERILQTERDSDLMDAMLEVAPEHLIRLLQQRALDELAFLLCERGVYRFKPDWPREGRKVTYRDLADWCQTLVVEAKVAGHPLNQRLLYERILNSVPSLADN